jgi:hypothetical protein
MAQSLSPLTNTGCVLNVIFCHIAIYQAHVVTMHAVAHEMHHGFFVVAQVIAQTGVESVGKFVHDKTSKKVSSELF